MPRCLFDRDAVFIQIKLGNLFQTSRYKALSNAFNLCNPFTAVNQILHRLRQEQHQQYGEGQRGDRTGKQDAVPAVVGDKPEEITPPPAAPNGKPQYMVLIAIERQRFGANSDTG